MATNVVRLRDRFLEAIDANNDALIAAIEATEARGDRVSKSLLAELRKGEKELLGLTRRWVDDPGGIYSNLEAMIETQARAQRRALELAREALNGADAYRAEVRDALRRMVKADRAAGESVMEALREATSQATKQAKRLPRPQPMRRERQKVRPSRIPVASAEVPRKLAG